MADKPASPTAEELNLLTDIAELQRELKKLSNEKLEILKKSTQLRSEIKGSIATILHDRKQSLEYATQELKTLESMRDAYRGIAKHADAKVLLADNELKIAKQILIIAMNKQRTDGESADAHAKIIKDLEKEVAIKKIALERAKEFLHTIEESVDAAKNMGSAIGSAGQVFQSNFISKAGEFAKIFSGGGLAIGQMVSQMTTSVTVAFINNMAGLAMQLIDVEANFRKATGASAEFGRSVTEVYELTRLYGVTAQEASAATQELFTTFTDFTMIGKENQKMLAQTSAVLSELGVANADFAKGVQISTKALGMSTDAAQHTQRELVTFAKEIGIVPQQMAADFAQAGNMMAKMGEQGVKAFKDLAHASKITGMEIQKLLGITNKFDTFEGAAEQAGKLNAALGGNFVNAMDLMMTTDPAERFNMIRDSILDAGLSFDSMSYYQKNFYKDALGLSDVGDLALMLSGNMDDLGGATTKTAEELITLKKNAAAVQSMQEQFNALIAEATPILTGVMDAIKGLIGFLVEWSEVIKVTISVSLAWTAVAKIQALWTGILAARTMALGVATGFTMGKFGAFVVIAGALYHQLFVKKSSPTFFVGLGLLTPLMKALGTATQTAGRQMATAAPALAAVGVAVAGIGSGIHLAATGTAELASAFKDLGDNAGWAALGIGLLMIPFIAFMALAYAVVAGPQAAVSAGVVLFLVGLGVAALALGKGMQLAAQGFSELVGSFTRGLQVIPELVDSITKLANSNGLDTLALQFERIAEAIKEIPETKAVAMAITMDSMASLAQVPNLRPKMEQAGEAIAQINDVNLARSTANARMMSATILNNIRESPRSTLNTQMRAPAPIVKQPITITLDRHKVGQAMVELWAEKSRTANGLG